MIDIQGLNKSFGNQRVLKDLTLQIPAGRATGLVGPNGSGKTTLIKNMLGLVKPDDGTIEIDGVQLNGYEEYRKKIGYMPQMARYPENMRVQEMINFIKKIRGVESANEQHFIETFDLQPELNKPLRELSGGTRQKVGATLALMFDSELLILDEPTAGLDPKASYRFKQLILDEKKRGKTILLTTHIMSEVEVMADYIIFIVEGEIRYHGSTEDLIKMKKEQRLEGAVAKMMEEVAA
ncbi:MAG: ABC transporter ATP-binding protein [Balneolaceae bacterium]|nr:ABC transporter ATP-binding protein [Balneolaceae bacterium]